MPRYKMVNGERIQFTAAEETARDAEESPSSAAREGEAEAASRGG